jgi:hypothetical protein
MRPALWRSVGVGVVLVAALALVRPGCRPVPRPQAVVPDHPGNGPALMEEMRRSELLARRGKVVSWELAQREALTADLLAGRRDLFGTAAGFRAVRQVGAAYRKPVALPFPGATEEERLCRQVIVYAEAVLRDEPGRPAVVARLERQLQEHLERDGTVRLPPSPRLDHPAFEPCGD